MKRRPYAQQLHAEQNLIRVNRLKAGLTQEELAERIGSSKQYVQKMETGPAEDLKMKWLLKMARVFDVAVADLIPNSYGPENSTIVFECRDDWQPDLKDKIAGVLERLETSNAETAAEITDALSALLRLSEPKGTRKTSARSA